MKGVAFIFALAACDKGMPAIDHDVTYRSDRVRAQFQRIATLARQLYAKDHAFPIGTSAELPVGHADTYRSSCCVRDDHGKLLPGECAPDPAAFARDPIWSKLEFSLDEPSAYTYRFGAQSPSYFTVFAIGDPDCTGKPTQYQLNGDATNGVVEITSYPEFTYP